MPTSILARATLNKVGGIKPAHIGMAHPENLAVTETNSFDQLSNETRFDLDDREMRTRCSPAAFRAYCATADFLSLAISQRCRLLGNLPVTTYRRWMKAGAPALTRDALERISLILGIVKAMRTLFADDVASRRWLTGANHDVPFGGSSPLDRMLRGSTEDLRAVRRYLDAWLTELT